MHDVQQEKDEKQAELDETLKEYETGANLFIYKIDFYMVI